MLNTHKLLYVLPDVAYVAELLPTKKEHTFAIQSFRQINGDFMDDNEFLAQNVIKLFSKLESDEYHLVLPDFLFTNTIVSVAEKSDAKIKEYLTTNLLPTLNLTNDTHAIETFVLTEFKGNSKVQLSAIERTVLAPIRVAAANASVKITAVSPLSWTIKSLISLEPSISVIQIGSKLYSALHLLGVDQTTMTEVGETEVIAETIKTLKGGEPNIQTVYLLSNELVETNLKETLSNTVPLQQLATFKDDDTQMPSYVKEIIESGMRTLSISDFPVPKFELGKPTEGDADLIADSVPAKTNLKSKNEDDEEIEEVSAIASLKTSNQAVIAAGETQNALPSPTIPPALSAQVTNYTSTTTEPELNANTDEAQSLATEMISTNEPKGLLMPTATSDTTESVPKTDSVTIPETPESNAKIKIEPITAAPDAEASLSSTLSNFAPIKSEKIADSPSILPAGSNEKNTTIAEPKTAVPDLSEPAVLKNNSGVSTMLKMVFITLAVFFATVAVGVGVGLGLLQFSNKDTNTGAPEASPTVAVSPEPTIEPSPSASPAAAIDATKLKVLVVNATTKAGYAGTIKSELEKVKFTGIAAGNAKGEYEEGNYLLVKEDSKALTDLIETATKLSFIANDTTADKAVEDPSGVYDVVVVLAE